jgi:hypothetical protein
MGQNLHEQDQTTYPPAADHGQYAAHLAESLRGLIDPANGQALPELTDKALTLLAAWDRGSPYAAYLARATSP